ncbi:MAG: WGR domain-containing protein [Motiliproteus sp.]|nr:WGR domain-containing protein [Motiliproteus sp.]MCW9053023.1 WGR domain-containing protein [Motiliproteus sp.]
MVILWRKQQHYFRVRLSQDLFGDWVVVRSWGNLNNNLCGCKQDVVNAYPLALELVEQIRRRQLTRGYQEATSND